MSWALWVHSELCWVDSHNDCYSFFIYTQVKNTVDQANVAPPIQTNFIAITVDVQKKIMYVMESTTAEITATKLIVNFYVST